MRQLYRAPANARAVELDQRVSTSELPRAPPELSVSGIKLEVARRLIADGETVELLALLDVYGPNYPRRRGVAEWLAAYSARLRGMSVAQTLRYTVDKMRAKLVNRNHALAPDPAPSGSTVGSSEEYLQGFERYAGRITLFRASIQPDSVRLSYDDPTNGWSAIAEGGVDVITVPGSHMTMIELPHLAGLADALRNCLRRFQPKSQL